MFTLLKELYSLLTPSQRKRFMRLQILVVIMAFAEIASVAAIAPFMAIVGDMSRLEGDGTLATLYDYSGLETHQTFLFIIGCGVLTVMVLGASFSMLTTWRMTLFANSVGAQLSQRLYNYYLHQPWLFHASGSSSQLTKQIAQEASRVTSGIIRPILQLNAKLFMAGFMILGLMIYDPVVAVCGLGIFLFSYALIFRLVHARLTDNGRSISSMSTLRYKLMSEGFGGIKDVLLLGRQALFTQRFIYSSNRLATAQAVNQALGELPRYAMQLIAFGSVMLLILYLLGVHQGRLGYILPVLSVYALAGYKMLPAFQQIYQSLAKIKGNIAAFESIRDAMYKSYQQAIDQDTVASQAKEELDDPVKIQLSKEIKLNDITLAYPGKDSSALAGLELTIKAKQVVGIVGASGSGKSTAIDVLLGLIQPQTGKLIVDGQEITDLNRRQWQNSIGFVPQSIFLSDASIRENIAFGIPTEHIDEDRVKEAAKMANISEFIEQLPQGFNTQVGERGVQLSGGQRQRIGIARALYDDAEVLILDEATSALDGITEKIIMDAIHNFSGNKTIIMVAHRLATVKPCDSIYLLAGGKVVDQGSYSDLISRNTIFQRMAKHA